MTALWTSAELAAALNVPDPGFDATGISFDTRTLKSGDLFVALAGERDGHDFIPEALAKGAAGLLVSRDVPGPAIKVPDTLAALRQLAAAACARTTADIIAVTGSVGKTTTKEMLRRALAPFGPVHAAESSFNNHLGVPVTLARLPRDAAFAVIEIGMNHPGEIAPLARLAEPDAAVITSIAAVHIGHMGSLEAIAREKASILSGLTSAGAAILPADAPFADILRAALPPRATCMEFGEQGAQAKLLAVQSTAESCALEAEILGTRIALNLAAPGRHMAMNALAALAACAGLGLDITRAAAALDGFAPVSGRGARRPLHINGHEILLLDESYNASSASVRAALAVLALQPGRRIAVLGDMLELGAHGAAEHLALAPHLSASADLVFTCGTLTKGLFDAMPPERQGAHAASAAALAPHLKAQLQGGDAVLVKGSYGSRMRDLILALESPA